MTGEWSDERLIDLCVRLRAGAPDAQDEMFILVNELLRPLASAILRLDFPRLRLQSETNDILNEVLCKLIPYLRTQGQSFSTGVGPFKLLLATVLRRTLIGLARKHYGRVRVVPVGEVEDNLAPGLWESSGLDDWRSQFRVHELIGMLDERHRQVIEAALYVNMSNAELAECLGISRGHASRRLSEAKEALGRLIAEDEQKAG